MKTLSLVKTVVVAMLCIGCDSIVVPDIELRPQGSLDSSPDGAAFADVRYLAYSDSLISFFDFILQQGVLVDESFKHTSAIGRKGRGPLEFTGCDGMFRRADSIYFADYSLPGLKLYTDGKISNITQEKMAYFHPSRFVINGGNAVFSCKSPNYLLASFMRHNNSEVSYFGTPIEYGSATSTMIHNTCSVFEHGGSYICVPEGLPYVYTVDPATNTTEMYDLSKIKGYRQSYKSSLKGRDLKVNQMRVINEDAYLLGEDLYILYATFGRSYSCNHVLRLHIGGSIFPVCTYTLPAKLYRTICATNNSIIAYNPNNGKIVRLPIPKKE
ncbi:MAG: hypothetical protein IJS07_08835 [Bacteroidales bacterium]|nr:hypothetical protein [Bacteroidales bacterium]